MTETPAEAARRLAAHQIENGFRPEALHEYQALDATPIYWRIRLRHPGDRRKWIRPMRANGAGYELGEPPFNGRGKPLYRLPEIASQAEATVWAVEGEWCADALAARGIVATTSGSADSAAKADWSPLAGREVVIWPDADEAGLRYAQHCTESLRAAGAASVRVVDVRPLELPAGGDAVDWLAAHPQASVTDIEALRNVEPPAAEYDAQARPYWPEPVDIAAMLGAEPPTPSMIIDDWLPCGYATLLAGHGGAGKSSIALHLSACIATGRAFFGLETERRRVLYLSCEDRRDVLHWRLSRIVQHTNIDANELGGLALMDLVGYDTLLMGRDPRTGLPMDTPAHEALRQRIADSGCEVLIVDGTADVYSGNENDRGEVKQFINALLSRIPERGALLLLAHVNKPTASATTTKEGYSGSTAWHNACRARWYLHPETETTDEGATNTGDLLLELQKSNLGRANQTMRFRWDDSAHLFVGESDTMSHFDERARDAEERNGIVAAVMEVTDSGDFVPAAATGQRTAFHVLSSTSAMPDRLKKKTNKKRFWRHIESLRRMDVLQEVCITRKDRHKVMTLKLKTAPQSHAGHAGNGESDIPRTMAACRPAGNAGNAAGGYRGSARAHDPRAQHCPACDNEGCRWCRTES